MDEGPARARGWWPGAADRTKTGALGEKGDGSEKHRPTLRVSPAAPLPQSLCSSLALCPSPAQLATPACNAPPPQEVRCGLLTEAPRTSGRCDALCRVRCSLSWSDDLRPSHPLNMKNSCFGGVRRKPIPAPSILVHRWCSSRSAGQGRERGLLAPQSAAGTLAHGGPALSLSSSATSEGGWGGAGDRPGARWGGAGHPPGSCPRSPARLPSSTTFAWSEGLVSFSSERHQINLSKGVSSGFFGKWAGFRLRGLRVSASLVGPP